MVLLNFEYEAEGPCLILFSLILTSLVILSFIFGAVALRAETSLSYRVKIEGIADNRLRKLLESVSQTFDRRQVPAASMNLLRKRAERDIPRLMKVLRAEGYYAAIVNTQIYEERGGVRVIFQIEPGPPFILGSVEIEPVEGHAYREIQWPDRHSIGLFPGAHVKSKSIVDGERILIMNLKTQGYPFPGIETRKVVADHATHSVAVHFTVDPGPMAYFGPTQINGLQSVDAEFVRPKIPWKEGDQFNIDLLNLMQNRLAVTGLFTMIQVKTGESIEENARLPVIIRLRERKHRTVKAGVSYNTDEGFGGKVAWEHRNFLRRGEKLGIAGVMSEIAFATEGSFRKPGFLRGDQSLLLKLRVAEDRPDAYTSRNIGSSVLLERRFLRNITMGGGFGYRSSQINQLGEKEGYTLLSLPLYVDRDTSDDLLNPARGTRITFHLEPFYDLYGSELGFMKGYAAFSHYMSVLRSPGTSLASRVIMGSITGAERDAIPADIRFYAGGGGSIRGYPFQSVGPLWQAEPIGGRSLLELSFEIRLRITESMGIVTFMDGGSAFGAEFPDFDGRLRWGTGLGFRYFTAVGPIRLDLGIPLNRRDGIDQSFQIYISLGQAF